MKLTGRERLRMHKTCFGKPMLVLQVEVEGYEFQVDTRSTECVKYFRDARVEDMDIEIFMSKPEPE